MLVAATDGRDGAVKVHQDAELSLAVSLPEGEKLTYSLKPGRRAWLQVARGKSDSQWMSLETGDGAAISEENVGDSGPRKRGDSSIRFGLISHRNDAISAAQSRSSHEDQDRKKII